MKRLITFTLFLTILFTITISGLNSLRLAEVKAQGSCPVIPITPSFLEAYNSVTLNGQPAPVGTVVEARSPRGITAGCFVVTTAGQYGMMPIYGEDTTITPNIPGMRDSETVLFFVNGITATANPALTWKGDLSQKQVDLTASLTTPTNTPTITPTTPTNTPTTPTNTNTPTITPTTPVPTVTVTVTPTTVTPMPTTPTPTDTPTSTFTPIPILTDTPTATSTPIEVTTEPTATNTPQFSVNVYLPLIIKSTYSTSSKVSIITVNKIDEYVEIQNLGGTPQYLYGWTLLFERGGERCSLGGTLASNQTRRIWALAADDDMGGYNCGFSVTIWDDNQPDVAVLLNDQGIEVSRMD